MLHRAWFPSIDLWCNFQFYHVADLPGWGELAAVRLESAYALDGNAYLNRSGPRLVDTLEILAQMIRPGRASMELPEEARRAAFRRLSGGGNARPNGL